LKLRRSKNPGWTEHVIGADIEAVTHSLGVADLDLDGDLDVVTAEMPVWNPDEVRAYRNRRRVGWEGAGDC
jgi:hypothetical protein